MKSLLTFLGSDSWGEGLSFWVSDGSSKLRSCCDGPLTMYTLDYARYLVFPQL